MSPHHSIVAYWSVIVLIPCQTVPVRRTILTACEQYEYVLVVGTYFAWNVVVVVVVMIPYWYGEDFCHASVEEATILLLPVLSTVDERIAVDYCLK